jgi:gluconate kinase
MHERQTDRRLAHRRAEDVRLHYARENLIAAALAWVERPSGDTDELLIRARNTYRAAELTAVAP